jgi:hypothetical protein
MTLLFFSLTQNFQGLTIKLNIEYLGGLFMVTITNLNQIKKSVETHLKSGNLELVVLPRVEYEVLLEKLDDLKDIHDSIEAMKEYQAGKRTSFDRYDARRKAKRV